MAGNVFDSLTSEQKLRLTVQKDVRSICQEATHYVGMEIDTNAMELIGELVWKKIQVYGSDLESFARHAKRSTINPDDVKLLVRRNPSLLTHITKQAEEISTSTVKKTKDPKRKRNTVQPASSVNNVIKSTTTVQNPEPSTSSAVTAPSAVTSKNDNSDDFNSDSSDDSPFVKMLHKRISERMILNNKDEEMIDLTIN